MSSRVKIRPINVLEIRDIHFINIYGWLDKTIKHIKILFYSDENITLVQRVFWNSLYIAFFLVPIDINYPTPFFVLAVIFGGMIIIKADKSKVLENRVRLVFSVY